MAAWVTLRRSRKLRRCYCGTVIAPGDQYLSHRCSPNHDDLGNTTWWREVECRACAVSHERWPIPNGGVTQR